MIEDVPNGTSTILTFMWNTTYFARSNYTIKAVADMISGEIDTDDNTLEDGAVLVGVPCDITGQTPGVPDGIVNMRDIGEACSNFGKT